VLFAVCDERDVHVPLWLRVWMKNSVSEKADLGSYLLCRVIRPTVMVFMLFFVRLCSKSAIPDWKDLHGELHQSHRTAGNWRKGPTNCGSIYHILQENGKLKIDLRKLN